MPTIGSLITLAAGKAKRAEVNSNFATIRNAANTYAAWVDQSATISGAWTFSTSPTISGALSLGNSLTVASGLTVTAGGLTVTAGGITVTAGASTFGANVTVTGTVAATTFSGSGASLTNLPAAQLTGDLPAISGASLTSLNASNVASGTLNTARLPSTVSVNAVSASSVSTGTLTATGDAIFGADQIFNAVDANTFSVNTNASAVIASAASAIDDFDFVLSGILSSDQSRHVKLITVAGEEWYVRIDRKTP